MEIAFSWVEFFFATRQPSENLDALYTEVHFHFTADAGAGIEDSGISGRVSAPAEQGGAV